MVPDAVVVGKAMGNGYPLSGVITTPALLSAFEAGPLYFNTFAGGNVACATGMAVLDALQRLGLQANAREVGARVAAGLLRLRGAFPEHVGDVRGRGFFQGVEFVQGAEGLQRSPGKAKWVQEALKSEHVRGSLVPAFPLFWL